MRAEVCVCVWGGHEKLYGHFKPPAGGGDGGCAPIYSKQNLDKEFLL